MSRILSMLAVFSLAAFGAAIDGKWTGQSKVDTKKGEQTFTVTLDAKADGDKLTGSFSMGAGRRPRAVEIKDGKLAGDKITFTTTLRSKQGERTLRWEGTLQGGELKLKRQGGRGRGLSEVTLKR